MKRISPALIALSLTQLSSPAEPLATFKNWILNPPSVIELECRQTIKSSTAKIVYTGRWENQDYIFSRNVYNEGTVATTTSGRYNGHRWFYAPGENVVRIYEQPDEKLLAMLKNLSGRTVAEIELYTILRFGISIGDIGDISWNGDTFQSDLIQGKITNHEEAIVNSIEYDFNGLIHEVDYTYPPNTPTTEFTTPAQFRIRSHHKGQERSVREYSIHKLQTTKSQLPKALINPEIIYSNATIVRISGSSETQKPAGRDVAIPRNPIRSTDHSPTTNRKYTTVFVLTCASTLLLVYFLIRSRSS